MFRTRRISNFTTMPPDYLHGILHDPTILQQIFLPSSVGGRGDRPCFVVAAPAHCGIIPPCRRQQRTKKRVVIPAPTESRFRQGVAVRASARFLHRRSCRNQNSRSVIDRFQAGDTFLRGQFAFERKLTTEQIYLRPSQVRNKVQLCHHAGPACRYRSRHPASAAAPRGRRSFGRLWIHRRHQRGPCPIESGTPINWKTCSRTCCPSRTAPRATSVLFSATKTMRHSRARSPTSPP